MSEGERRGSIIMAYREAYMKDPARPFLNAKLDLPGRLGIGYGELAADIEFLEQNRYLHWKSENVFKLSPKGLRASRSPGELAREF